MQALDYRKLAQLRRSFRHGIETGTRPPTAITHSASGTRVKAVPSYKVHARSTLLKRLQELEALSPSLFEPHKVEPLHEMRIGAKRLRYAMELFAACWVNQLKLFSRHVAQMQSSLGELHDCDLWIEHFGKRLARVRKKAASERATSEDERDAMIWLLSHFSRLRTKHFRAALARWHQWEEKDLGNRLAATLRT